jgi:hypothetical protein
MTTVAKLKAAIADLPDDTPVLMPAEDHSYRLASFWPTTALQKGRSWTEDYGEETTPEAEWGKRVDVFVVGAG